MFEEVVDTFSNTSSRTSYKPKSPQRQNDDDDWKLGCGFLVFIIVAVFFCVKTCGSDSSTNERIEGVDSVDRIESVDTKHIQDQKPVVSESKDVQTTKADFSNIISTINEWNYLDMVSVTESGSAVAVYKGNGYTYQNISNDLIKQLQSINSNKCNIQDINLVSSESFVIIFGTNGYWSVGAPIGFSDKLKQFHDNQETILSACFNKKQEWCIVTNKHYSYSNERIKEFLSNAESQYGHINYVYLSENGIIACCNSGISWINIPKSVAETIKNYKYYIKIIKFTDSGRYCIASGDGRSSFRL